MRAVEGWILLYKTSYRRDTGRWSSEKIISEIDFNKFLLKKSFAMGTCEHWLLHIFVFYLLVLFFVEKIFLRWGHGDTDYLNCSLRKSFFSSKGLKKNRFPSRVLSLDDFHMDWLYRDEITLMYSLLDGYIVLSGIVVNIREIRDDIQYRSITMMM